MDSWFWDLGGGKVSYLTSWESFLSDTATTQVLPSPVESRHGSVHVYPGASDTEIEEYVDHSDRLHEELNDLCEAAGFEFWVVLDQMMSTIRLLNTMDEMRHPSLARMPLAHLIAGWEEGSWRRWLHRRLISFMPGGGLDELNVQVVETYSPN